jgi:putative ABC transport system permease protein
MNTRSETQDTKSARVSAPLIPIIKENYPEAESAARLLVPWWEISIQKDDKAFQEEKVYYTDNDIFNILSFTFIIGNPEKALRLPRTMVISENMAQKYFRNENPIGSVLQVNDEMMEVSGVFKNLPDNTHLKCNILISLNTLSYDFDRWWGWAAFYSYIKLRQNVISERFNTKILHIAQEYTGIGETEYLYYLQPLSKIHFSSGIHQEIESPGNIQNVLFLLSMGLLILIIGCINYINLTIVLFTNREKEIGFRQVAGAQRSQLMKQFFIESFLITLSSLLLALLIIYFTLPTFNAIADKHFDILLLMSLKTIIILFLQTFLISLIAGCLSVYFISIFKSGIILKAKVKTGFRETGMQKALISFQFTLAIILMISTLVILEQIYYMKSRNLGFDKEQKLIINVDFKGDYELVKNEFLKHSEINSITASHSVPGRIEGRFYTSLVGNAYDRTQIMDYLYVDYDYIPFYNLKILHGRTFEKRISTDSRNAFIINKAATEALGFTSPDKAIGNRIREGGEGIEGIIIGVTDNFHYKGLQKSVEPLVMQIKPDRFRLLSLTINTVNIRKTLDFVEKNGKS